MHRVSKPRINLVCFTDAMNHVYFRDAMHLVNFRDAMHRVSTMKMDIPILLHKKTCDNEIKFHSRTFKKKT
jgi:hypothetical protein